MSAIYQSGLTRPPEEAENGRSSKLTHLYILYTYFIYIYHIFENIIYSYIVSYLLAESDIPEEGPGVLKICCLHPQLCCHG